MMYYCFYRFELFLNNDRDDFFSAIHTHSFEEIGSYDLKDGDLQFKISIFDPDFDNDDNPYAKLKLHRMTNMVDS